MAATVNQVARSRCERLGRRSDLRALKLQAIQTRAAMVRIRWIGKLVLQRRWVPCDRVGKRAWYQALPRRTFRVMSVRRLVGHNFGPEGTGGITPNLDLLHLQSRISGRPKAATGIASAL